MDKFLGLFVDLNDVEYECKIPLPMIPLLQSLLDNGTGKVKCYHGGKYNIQINKRKRRIRIKIEESCWLYGKELFYWRFRGIKIKCFYYHLWDCPIVCVNYVRRGETINDWNKRKLNGNQRNNQKIRR